MFVIYTYLKNTSIFSFHPVILITKARNRTADNTLLIRIASNLYINCNMAALGWPGSCNIEKYMCYCLWKTLMGLNNNL